MHNFLGWRNPHKDKFFLFFFLSPQTSTKTGLQCGESKASRSSKDSAQGGVITGGRSRHCVPLGTGVVGRREKSASVRSGVDVTQHAAQRLNAPGGAHGWEGHGLRLVLHRVEAARPQVVRHAGDVAEVPRSHGAEGGAESPHLRREEKSFSGVFFFLFLSIPSRPVGPE